MAKCEVIDLTLSDNDTDGDFIQAKKAIHSFCINFLCSYYIKFLYIKFLLYQVPIQRKLFHRTHACT